MRKRQTFLLTILSDTDNASYCGQIKVVGSGKTINFSHLEELSGLISEEMTHEKQLPDAADEVTILTTTSSRSL